MNIEVIFHYYTSNPDLTQVLERVEDHCPNMDSSNLMFDVYKGFFRIAKQHSRPLTVEYTPSAITVKELEVSVIPEDDIVQIWPYRKLDPYRRSTESYVDVPHDWWVHHIEVNGTSFRYLHTVYLYLIYLFSHEFKEPDWRAMRRIRRKGRRYAFNLV